MLKGYIDYLRGDKKSENTVISYSAKVQSALDAIGKEEAEISKVDIVVWKAGMADKTAATINAYMSALESYFDYLVDIGIVETNVVTGMKRPAIKHKEKKFIEAAMLRSMVNAATNIRDRALVLVLGSTGLRVSEFISLTLDDYRKCKNDPDHSMIVLGKGDKERVVFFNDEVINAIDNYLIVRGTKDKGFDNLFLSNQGTVMQEKMISKSLKRIAKLAGIPFWDEVTPHYLRSACASINLENGAPITAVRDLLGHASISTTNIYAKAARNAVRNMCQASAF